MSKGKHEAQKPGRRTAGPAFGETTKRKKPQKSAGAVALIALTCVAAALVLVVGVWKSVVKPPDIGDNTGPGVPQQPVQEDVTPGSDQPQQAPETEADPEPGSDPEPDDGRKEDVYTFLLMGKDTSSESTDTIILVTYDVPNGSVSCMSIPRDTMVNVKWDIKRVNSVYSAKESSGGKIKGLKNQIGYLTGIVPDFYVIIEWKAVGELVDALGGVYFDVPYDMNYDDPYQELHIHQEKGYRLLSGEDAMEVVRWRQNNDGTNYGDTARVQVQQDFLKAVAKQCLQLKNVTKVTEFARIFFNNVETDLPLTNLLWFAEKAMSVDMEQLRFMTLPGNYEGWAWSRTYKNNQSYVFAYPEEVVEMVNTWFNPYNRDITEDDLQIMYRNKDGSLGITNGTVLDTEATKVPVKPAKKPAEEKPEDEKKEEGTQQPEESQEPQLPEEEVQAPAEENVELLPEPEPPAEEPADGDDEQVENTEDSEDLENSEEKSDISEKPEWLN